MHLDKNVIFIYPLNTILNELKKELEKDESFSVLEVDMLSEYVPLIESIHVSITFSADIKKTAMFLEACKKYTKEKSHHHILISKQTPSGLVHSRMEKDGLNEFLGDFTRLKTLMVKINHFYKDVLAKVDVASSFRSTLPDEIDSVSEQRIERLIVNNKGMNASSQEETQVWDDIKPAENLADEATDPSLDPLSESLADGIELKKESAVSTGTLAFSEITFYPALRVFDPIAFYMEILLSKSDSDFRKRYLKMCLLKVYQARLFTANSEGVWEEETPESLKEFNSIESRCPTWVNEGRNEFENLFIMPIIFDDSFLGGIGLVIAGQINHEKMIEMEFWCYLSRCLCN